MSDILDIFEEGDVIGSVWADEDFLYVSFPYATVSFPLEHTLEFVHDLKKIALALEAQAIINPSFGNES